MSITLADITIKRSFTVSDAAGNGGLPGTLTVLPGVRHAIMPRITPLERANGLTRYRKVFVCNQNADEDIAYSVSAFLQFPSPGGDRFGLAAATAKSDTQAEIDEAAIEWLGIGALVADVTAGGTSLQLAMEDDDFTFPDGGTLFISNRYRVSQTITAGVRAGDSVQYADSTWGKISPTNDVAYPKGLYLGSNTVLTIEGTTSEEFVTMHATDPVSWAGNTATITLADALVNNYATANTYACACVTLGDITPSVTDLAKTSTNGTYDNSGYPIQVFNRSTVDDAITLTFSSATAFTASGATLGSLGGGTVSQPFSPVNGSALPYFTIPAGFFGGTWATGNTLTFSTVSAAAALWFREIVPAGMAAESNNLLSWGLYAE